MDKGRIVEKPQGLSGKSSPGEESEAEGFSRGGNFFQISPKTFPRSVRLWFLRGARTFIPREVRKKFGKAAVRSVHCRSQIALIGNQSLVGHNINKVGHDMDVTNKFC